MIKLGQEEKTVRKTDKLRKIFEEQKKCNSL